MPAAPTTPPALARDGDSLQLTGSWTLEHADAVATVLQGVPDGATRIDASGIERLDSMGVLQLLRFAGRRGLHGDALGFHADHLALVSAIEDVADDRPRKRREYGISAALARLGKAMHHNGREIVALVSFLGESLAGLAGIARDPRRLRVTSTVHHMEQVGLDAMPLVALLSFMVGAVIAYLGSTILAEFGATLFVVELVGIAFLREFGVLLTAILLAGRTASAFTAQIGIMVTREEVDAVRTLGLDPVELLVIPRLLALLVMLPLLTFIAMVSGLLGGMAVAAFELDIPPQAFITRLQDTLELRHFFVGLSKAPVFALVIGLIGCLEGMQVQGTAQSLGERTTSSVVQTISLVILLDAFAAIWFMQVGW